MPIKKVAETMIDGWFPGWEKYSLKLGRLVPCVIKLFDGSSWMLDESPAGREYNERAAEHVPPFRGVKSHLDAWVMKNKDKFYLRVEREGKRRQVVPVHLSDPEKYYGSECRQPNPKSQR